MSRLQKSLDRINRRLGGIGSLIVSVFWLLLLYYALYVILGDLL